MTPDRHCRECGITEITPGTEIDGEPLCWADDDLCSHCQDLLAAREKCEAARYRYLRNQQKRVFDLAADHMLDGVRAVIIPDGAVLGGENLDRAIDTAMGMDVSTIEPLEKRLAKCLAEIIDTPVLTGRDELGGFTSPLDIRLGFFLPKLSERAAELLEEAGE